VLPIALAVKRQIAAMPRTIIAMKDGRFLAALLGAELRFLAIAL